MSIFVVICSLHDDGRRESLCRTIEDTYASPHDDEQRVVALAPSTFAIKSLDPARRITQVLQEPLEAANGDWLITHEMSRDGTDCFGAANPEAWFDVSCFKERLVENVVTTMLRGPSAPWSRDELLHSVREIANDYLWRC